MSPKGAILLCLCIFLLLWNAAHGQTTPREIIARALLLETPEEQAQLVSSLVGQADPAIPQLLTAWKEGGIYLYEPTDADGNLTARKVAVTLGDDKDAEQKQLVLRLDTTKPLLGENGQPLRLLAEDLTTADTDSDLRQAMKVVLDVFALVDPSPARRLAAIEEIGLAQNPEKIGVLRRRAGLETDLQVQRAIRLSIAMLELQSEDATTQIEAAGRLGALRAIAARDALRALRDGGAVIDKGTRAESQGLAGASPSVAFAAGEALAQIDRHLRWVNFYGTLFRGLSLGSVLLVVAIGLAITFGLMGVINMAHGELIAVGAYTTYLVQCVFGAGLTLSPFNKFRIALPGLHSAGATYELYFLVAIPLSFLAAALVGIALERGIIRFLYRRPLESLLATWGVSLVLQQLFRSFFGANNVQVDSPAWLSGHWTVFDVILGWNRVFVIAFASAIIGGTWLILNKTPLGLLIRAVMQNRQMAACLGVRTERVNMLTFGFGSGLAGLAGAFLSQIGNVGPSLGQSYVVDAFMTVVVGGVGNIFGTVISALGIGITDQSLQQILGNPVLGKILVLGAIILFLQWKPAGMFVTRSRSLEG